MKKLRDEPTSLNTNEYKSFSKGCFIVRKRCIKFIEALKTLGYQHEIPLDEAKELFSRLIGPSDRKTLKAYFGTQASQSIKKIQKIARYSTGTYSFKNIELAQEVQKQRGYLEILGLAKIEQRGNNFFMVLINEPLTPELFPQQYESLSSMKNFSLPHIPSSLIEKPKAEALEGEGISRERESLPRTERLTENNKQTTTYRVGERNPTENRFLPPNGEKHNEYASICLTPEEEAILNAKFIDSEPDRAKIKWSDNHE